MDLIVLDASAAVEILLRTHTGRSLQTQLPAPADAWVPEHFYSETASVLRRAELRSAVTPARAERAIARLELARFHRAQVRPLLRDAWRRRGHLTIADALYVVLAEQVGATLVTADLNLAGSPGLAVPTITP